MREGATSGVRGFSYLPLLFAIIVAASAILYLAPAPEHEILLARFSTSLLGRTGAQRRNAFLAAQHLNGAAVEPGQEFSFNERVGSWSRDQGYRRAPVSYNGTLIADWGGGVCQTSTTLYNAALLAGMKITERNPHRFSPEYVAPGRDAAVAYDDIDLRFVNPLPETVRIQARINGDRLEIGILGDHPLPVKPEIITEIRHVEEPQIFRLPGDGGTHFIKNTGKAGCEVATYRVTGSKRELLSVDSYPVMNKIEESGG